MTSCGVGSTLRRGLEFVRYALNTVWFGEPDRLPILRGKNVRRDFSDKLNGAGRGVVENGHSTDVVLRQPESARLLEHSR